MTTLTMPSSPYFSAQGSRIQLLTNAKILQSPANLSSQTALYVGSVWAARYVLPPMTRDQAADWMAFLIELEGMSGRFYGPIPGGREPRGAATGTPLVKGAAQTGSSLVTDGWTAGVTGILKTGDFIGVGGFLYMVTADANSDGTGNATLSIKPQIRTAPSDNAPITTTNPTTTMRLTGNEVGWDISSMMIYGLEFEGIETFV